MSRVMNVILTTGCGETPDRIAALNGILWLNSSTRGFAPLPASHSSYIGGTKAMECDVYLAAFNYLPLAAVVRAMHATRWNEPEQVQLFVKDEDDRRFTEIDWQNKEA